MLLNPINEMLDEEESKYVMNELHNGICGLHSGLENYANKSTQGRVLLANSEKRPCQGCKKS